jgi:hypothetical protein
MAYSQQHRATVLIGGNDSETDRQTWLWNGSEWQELTGRNPRGKRFAPGMTSFNRRVVLYGGFFSLDNPDGASTWIFGQSGWHRRAKGTDAGRMIGPSLVYDEAREQVVLFGGWRPDDHLDDTWVLEPTA